MATIEELSLLQKAFIGKLENNEMFITRLASNPETQEEAAVAAGVPWLNFRPISHHCSSKPKQTLPHT